MLVEFSVANFRSFADEQTISLSAGRFRSERVGAVLDTPSKTSPHLLRAAAIMGANGSGKTSLIRAMDFMQGFIRNSAQSMQKGDRIPVSRYKLDEDFQEKPSYFCIVFIFESIEYHYSFSVTDREVISERLLSRSRSSSIKEVFSREKSDGSEVWNLGTLPKTQSKLWKQSTRSNALFLSTSVQLNSEELSKPFEWITQYLRIQTIDDPFSSSLTSHMIKDHVEDGCRSAILDLLRESDLGIRDVKIEEAAFEEAILPSDIPEELKKTIMNEMRDEVLYSPSFEHKTRQMKSEYFDFDDESDGTQKLYAMAGPIVSSLKHNFTLVIDEIESSLHPYIVRFLVDKFQNPAEQTSAQLIFTTHNDGILDAGILERDQFWFVEKRRGSSELIPLLDYKPRKSEAMRLNYLRGRYGGVPAIPTVKRT